MMKTNRQSGFTLIELLVVVAIIGILASIALPKLFAAICTAKEGQASGTISALNSAMSVYYGRNEGIFPTEASANINIASATSDLVGTSDYNFGQYYATDPSDPWGLGQDFKYAGSSSSYTISVKLNGGNGCDGSTGNSDDCFFYSNNLGKIIKTTAATCL